MRIHMSAAIHQLMFIVTIMYMYFKHFQPIIPIPVVFWPDPSYKSLVTCLLIMLTSMKLLMHHLTLSE